MPTVVIENPVARIPSMTSIAYFLPIVVAKRTPNFEYEKELDSEFPQLLNWLVIGLPKPLHRLPAKLAKLIMDCAWL